MVISTSKAWNLSPFTVICEKLVNVRDVGSESHTWRTASKEAHVTYVPYTQRLVHEMNSGKKIEFDVRFEVVVLLGQILVPRHILCTLRLHRDTVYRGTTIKSCLECWLGGPDTVLHHWLRQNGTKESRQGKKYATAEFHLFMKRFDSHNTCKFLPFKVIYVLVISRLGGMLRVYRPEGRGSINRHIPTRRDITNLYPVARCLYY